MILAAKSASQSATVLFFRTARARAAAWCRRCLWGAHTMEQPPTKVLASSWRLSSRAACCGRWRSPTSSQPPTRLFTLHRGLLCHAGTVSIESHSLELKIDELYPGITSAPGHWQWSSADHHTF